MVNRGDEPGESGERSEMGVQSLKAQMRVDLDALRIAEQGYRQLLIAEPGDMEVRVDLAWCLFMQALHLAGQESMCCSADTASEYPATGRFATRPVLEREARSVLRECLQQTITVSQLSRNRQDQLVIEKLQALVRLAYGESAVVVAEGTARRVLAEITTAVMNAADPSSDA